jgi:CRP/FNR family transcriptional regulator
MYCSPDKPKTFTPRGVTGVERYLDIDARELARVEAISVVMEVNKNRCLFMSGEPAQHVFLVFDGALQLSMSMPDGRRLITALALEGDFVGLWTGDTYAYSAETLLPSRLCRLPKTSFNRLLDDCPQLRSYLIRYSKGEMQRVQERMILLGQKTGAERLAAFMLQLADRATGSDAEKTHIALPMGRADIADYLGLTIETVSRLIGVFQKNGLLSLEGTRKVVLRDRRDLRRIADGRSRLLPPSR